MILLGITGTDGAGKGAVVDYLVDEHGFATISARSIWLDEIRARGLPENREHMRLVANDLRKQHGNDYFVAESLRRNDEEPQERLILDSVRALAEVETLKECGGTLLAVDAEQTLRYKRIQARASESDTVSFEDFVQHEALEMNDPDPSGMQKAAVIAAADYTVHNNGTIEELYAQVDTILEKLCR